MAKKMTTKKTVKVDKPVKTDKLVGLVTVIGTDKSEFMKTGKEYEVSPVLANTVVKSGHAKFKK